MERLNKYLLTHYPLLWNLRIHLVWPVIILLHLLMFIAGYASISFPESLHGYSLRVRGGTMSLAILSAMLIGVMWLLFYFRNNAFKSYYPLKRGRLVAEAFLILITCLGLTSFIASYAGGAYSHMRSLTADTDLRRETDVVNLAHHFIPFSRNAFASSNDCMYRKDEKEGNYDEEADAFIATDSSTAYNRPAVDTFSYLHYCFNSVVVDVPGVRTERGNDSVAKRWLLNGRTDSVRMLLKEYLSICKKYRAGYRFDADRQVKEIFAEPGFPVRIEISQYSDYFDNDDDSSRKYRQRDLYIEDQKTLESLRTIEDARSGWMDGGTALFMLYWSLGMALVIFSFRITSVRPWFIALIGAGIWCAIFGVLGSFAGGRASGYVMTVLFILLSISFHVVALYLVRRKEAKRNAGVAYLWALWSLPAVIPILMAWLESITAPEYVYDTARSTGIESHSPLHDWIQSNWPLIGSGNLIFFLLMLVLFFIPLARKWQAMPEE